MLISRTHQLYIWYTQTLKYFDSVFSILFCTFDTSLLLSVCGIMWDPNLLYSQMITLSNDTLISLYATWRSCFSSLRIATTFSGITITFGPTRHFFFGPNFNHDSVFVTPVSYHPAEWCFIAIYRFKFIVASWKSREQYVMFHQLTVI